MYVVEFTRPSGHFDSIPESMWWAVTTLTTVGYADVVPTSPLGKVVGSVVALAGIGFIALPAGILGAGFRDELQKQKAKKRIVEPTPSVYIAYEIRKLAELCEDGLITHKEFLFEKERLLKREQEKGEQGEKHGKKSVLQSKHR